MIGYIYCLLSNQSEMMYIGSTTKKLCDRFSGHKYDFRNYDGDKSNYITSFELLKYNDCYIELIKICNIANRTELNKIEGAYILKNSKLGLCVNKYVSGHSKKEWYEDNKEEILKQRKQHYIDNKEGINKKQKQHYIDNKKEINKKTKQYYNDNKEEIKKNQKQYNLDHKEEIKQRNSKLIICDCGQSYTHHHKSRHEQSYRHKIYTCNMFNLTRLSRYLQAQI